MCHIHFHLLLVHTHTLHVRMLTVAMAWFRFVVVAIGKRSRLAKFCCSVRGTKHVVAALVALSLAATVPNCLMHVIVSAEPPAASASASASSDDGSASNTGAGYWVGGSALSKTALKQLNFVLYGVGGKIVGSALLGLLSLLLILSLRQAQAAAARMRKRHRARRRQRISLILALVTLLFALTEAPQGVLLVVSSFSDEFFSDEYAKLGDLLDLLTLLNSALNFALYVAMSRQFRAAFTELFACVCHRRAARQNRTASMLIARRQSSPFNRECSSGRTSDPETNARLGADSVPVTARLPLSTNLPSFQ